VKPIRVGAALYVVGPLQCPRCGRRDVAHHEGYGILRQTCDGKACRASWVAIRLPPGATAAHLEHAFGLEVARAIGTAFVVGADAATYAQRAPDVPEPLMGWHRAASILFSLMGAHE
jgi:hypothetical protein